MSSSLFSMSSRKSVGASSTASFRSKRSVVNSALILANMSLGGDRVNLDELRGSKYDSICGKLGEDKYNTYCGASDLELVTINYCQSELEQAAEISLQGLKQYSSGSSNVSQGQVEKIKQMRGLINHDYLVLELQCSSAGPLYILAEKTGHGTEVGIHIDPLVDRADIDYRLHDGVKLHNIDCQRKRIKLTKIQDILKEALPHYNLKDNNCWDYAFAATQRLLKECMVCDGISGAEYKRLKAKHDNLESDLNQKNVKNSVKMAMAYISGSSRRP